MAFQLADSGAKIVIALNQLAPLLEGIRPQTGMHTLILTSLDDSASLDSLPAPAAARSETLNLLTLLGRFAGHERPNAAVDGSSPAVFQYSGGTTGTAKAAVGLHRNLAANTLQFRAWLGGLEAGSEVVLAAIPFFHVYGMVIAMSMGIQAGASLVLIPNGRDIPAILQGITRHQATLFPGVPNLYRLINLHPEVQSGKTDLHSIKACICGSAPLLPEIKSEFERLTGGKLLEGYGLSEAPTATHCNLLKGDNRPGSIGLPLPDVDCRIVSLDGREIDLPTGEAGELLVRGPQIMAGYHRQPEESAAALAGGWLHTGDVARMDGEGYFYLVDRKKDVIKVGGLQVWPREVEEAIASHPDVLEAGAAGVMHPEYGEMVKAWVVLRPGAALEAEDVRAWVRRRLADFKAPRQVVFMDALPRSSVGKLLRRELRSRHEKP
jgi:long-chain acyl-CoA synthetase